MFVFNFKISKNKIFKLLLSSMTIFAIIILSISTYKFFKEMISNNNEPEIINDSFNVNQTAVIQDKDLTNVLEMVHRNIDSYVGQEIKYTGYIYRLAGFNDDQFIVARDMDIGDNQSLIVGFLCSCENANNYSNNSWVEIKGTITKGKYNGQYIPLIKITECNQVEMPTSPMVTTPNENFIQTSSLY